MKKERVRQVYELHVTGKSYSQIAAIIGRTKAAILALTAKPMLPDN